MKIDVCMLAYSKNQALWDMTQRAIDSLHASEDDHQFNVMVMDSKGQKDTRKEVTLSRYLIRTTPHGTIPFMGVEYPAPKGTPPGGVVRLLNVGGRWECDYNNAFHSFITIKPPQKAIDKEFNGAKTYSLPGMFNYNKSINFCIDRFTAPYFLVTNNDVIYHKNWFTEMLKVKGWDSASAWDNHDTNHKHMKGVIEAGYGMTYHVRAHSIISTRNTIEQIGHYDERFDFYYQDNDYIEMLKKLKLKHYHIGTAQIDHVHHGTTSTYGGDWERKKFAEDRKVFEAKWGPL